MEITLGVQQESLKGEQISQMHPRVNELFEKHMSNDYCDAIDEIALILRLSSEQQEFGPDTIERRRFMKKQRYITIDIVLNEETYDGKPERENRDLLLRNIDAAFQQCIEKLVKAKCVFNTTAFETDFKHFSRDFKKKWKNPQPKGNRIANLVGEDLETFLQQHGFYDK